jgi:hypothetical protein
MSNDPDFHNDFATTEAWTVLALQGTYWKAMVTVNLDPTTTQALSPKREVRINTGTGNLTGGSVYVVNGTTCIARNNADTWDTWSNPFENSTWSNTVAPTIRHCWAILRWPASEKSAICAAKPSNFDSPGPRSAGKFHKSQ